MTKTYPKRDPNRRPTHPGALLRDIVLPELMTETKLTKSGFADAIKLSRQQLHHILSEKQPVTPETAVKLEAAIGGSARTWLTMQADHDLWGAQQTVDVTDVRQLRVA